MEHGRFVALHFVEKARREIERGDKKRAITLLSKAIVHLSE